MVITTGNWPKTLEGKKVRKSAKREKGLDTSLIKPKKAMAMPKKPKKPKKPKGGTY